MPPEVSAAVVTPAAANAVPVTTPAAVAPVVAPVTPAVSTPAVVPVVPAVTAPTEYKFDPVEGVSPDFDKSVTELAQKLGWSQDIAKQFRDHEIAAAKAEQLADVKASADAKIAADQRIAQEDAQWNAINRAHPEFGGAKYEETNTKIDKLFAEYDKSGDLSKHLAQVPRLKAEPAFRAFLGAIAQAHGEGRFIQGGSAQPSGGQSASLAEMYPSMVKR